MESLRSFIALELSPEVQEGLGRIQGELRKADADVKWVNPQGIHLTLKFLGNVSPQLLQDLKKAIDELAKKHRRFEMQINQVGAFPKVEYPRVIWVGIEAGSKAAVKLAQDLEERLIHFGFQKEKRPFNAHLTLGRVRSPRNRNQLKQLLLSTDIPQVTMQAETIVLFKSTLTPKGAIYEPLHQARLS